MVLQKLQLGRSVQFVAGSNNSGWHPDVFRIVPLIIGVASLATTLVLGSILWRFVTRRRKNKKQDEIPTFDPESLSLPDPKLSKIVSLRDFLEGTQAFTPKVSYHGNNADDDASSEEFDPEEDYAQVLAEARCHAGTSQIAPVFDSLARHSSVETARHSSVETARHSSVETARHSTVETWLARSPDIRRHDFTLEEAEAVFEQHHADILQSQPKSEKSWKRLLFWKRSKTSDRFEFDLNGVHSSSTTPVHHAFKSSRTRASVAPTFASVPPSRIFTSKRPTSGPIYYDGIRSTPNRSSRPFSSPLSGCSTPIRDDGLLESTYVPLKRPYSTSRTCPSPLYVP